MLKKNEFRIHAFWIGGKPPTRILENIRDWRSKYPNSIKFWTDIEIENTNRAEILNLDYPEAMKVDLLRVEVVKEFGGWYVDADTKPQEMIFPFVNSVTLVREDSKRFWNGCFFAPKNHPFLEVWQHEIKRSIRESWPQSDNVASISGPLALSRAIYVYASTVGAVQVKEELQMVGWSFVRWGETGNYSRIYRKYILKSAALLHQGDASWKLPSQKSTPNFSKILYDLRRSHLSSILEFARQIIKNHHRFPKSLVQLKMILNMDNEVLDFKIPGENFIKTIMNKEELEDCLRNLEVGAISSVDQSVQDCLDFAGWGRVYSNVWVRPKLTKLVGKINQNSY
jgi:hypothetical protein